MEPTDRIRILSLVLSQAQEVGLEEALNKFGSSLPEVDKAALRGLSSEELIAASKLNDTLQLVDTIAGAAANNNNNNRAQI